MERERRDRSAWGPDRRRAAGVGLVGATLAAACAVGPARADEAKSPPRAVVTPAPEAWEFFEARVRPILVERCGKCHGARKQSSGLRLDSRRAILEGGDSGPAVIP